MHHYLFYWNAQFCPKVFVMLDVVACFVTTCHSHVKDMTSFRFKYAQCKFIYISKLVVCGILLYLNTILKHLMHNLEYWSVSWHHFAVLKFKVYILRNAFNFFKFKQYEIITELYCYIWWQYGFQLKSLSKAMVFLLTLVHIHFHLMRSPILQLHSIKYTKVALPHLRHFNSKKETLFIRSIILCNWYMF